MRVFTALIVVLALAASSVGAQESASLTLRQALSQARAANPELAALTRQYESVRAAIPEARYLDPPMFETQIWGWRVTTLNPARTEMYMFTGEQMLPGKGKRAAREKVAIADSRLSEVQLAVRANEILDEVREAFAELYLARATTALFGQQKSLLQAIADAASVRYTTGESGQHDTVKSLVESSRVDVDAIQWRERAQLAETQLNLLLGRNPGVPVPALTLSDIAVDEDDAERLAVSSNPQLRVAAATITREEAELSRLLGERRPDYVVGGGYMLQPGSAGSWTARAGLTWPNAPWSRGRIDTRITAQERRIQAARATREALELAVRSRVHVATIKLAAARGRVELLETTLLPHITHAFDAATIAYQSNRGQYSDLLDSQRVLLTTRMDLIAAQTDVQRAAADLEFATGVVPGN